MTVAVKLARAIDAVRAPDGDPGEGHNDRAQRGEPIVDWCWGIRLPGRRYYVDIRLGRERRSPARLAADGQARLPVATLVYCGVGSVFFSGFGILCFVYLLKSFAGINLMGAQSPLHPLYSRLFE